MRMPASIVFSTLVLFSILDGQTRAARVGKAGLEVEGVKMHLGMTKREVGGVAGLSSGFDLFSKPESRVSCPCAFCKGGMRYRQRNRSTFHDLNISTPTLTQRTRKDGAPLVRDEEREKKLVPPGPG